MICMRCATNGHIPSGPRIAPKTFTIIHCVERGKPYILLAMQGINLARERNGIEGMGTREKAKGFAVMAKHKGSKFALT